MATAVVSTDLMRDTGATNDYFIGSNGRVVVYRFDSSVVDAATFNVGPGCQWVAWENDASGSVSPVGAILNSAGDQVTFETSSTRSGNLWAFYKQGCGGQGSAAGTITASGVREISRDFHRMRMKIYTVTSITAGNTTALKQAGVMHAMVRADGSGLSQTDCRFTSGALRSVGTLTWSVVSGTKQCKLVLLCAPGTGLT